jgi:N-acetylglucosaminyldiphosphoundecaprenol N-acetyl-beta-D-mannosaminyltransferase
MRTLAVLGTPLLLTDYVGLSDACLEWARSGRVVALEFSNTQIVTMRRHEPAFRALTSVTDAFAPDGMPLIWCLNRRGAGLKDRVYGPIFMRHFLERAPSDFTHYLLGGSEECGRRLRETFQKANPGLKFIGGFHGRCGLDGSLPPEDDARLFDELARLRPDFIWIGFGTPKQQAWIQRNKHRLSKGVLLSVGFAFDVNAGMKPDAPLWMQQLGLTWVFRLCSEPKRLGPRYFKWNLLFLWYLLADALGGRATGGNSG